MIDAGLARSIGAFLVVLGVGIYMYAALHNKQEVEVEFMGSKKKLSVMALILISLLDGIVMGLILGYLLFAI